MSNALISFLKDNKIAYHYQDGIYRLRYSYVDKNSMNCNIWIETKDITDNIINRLLKNGLY